MRTLSAQEIGAVSGAATTSASTSSFSLKDLYDVAVMGLFLVVAGLFGKKYSDFY